MSQADASNISLRSITNQISPLRFYNTSDTQDFLSKALRDSLPSDFGLNVSNYEGFKSPEKNQVPKRSDFKEYTSDISNDTVKNKQVKENPKLKSDQKKYNGFYADYCQSFCSNQCQCKESFPFDILTTYLLQKNCCSKKITTKKTSCTKVSSKTLPVIRKASAVRPTSPQTDTNGSGSLWPCPPSLSKGNFDTKDASRCIHIHSGTIKDKTKACEESKNTNYPCEEKCNDGITELLESSPNLQNKCCSVKFTSTIMVLFFIVFLFYTMGLNLGEYICYKTGQHGRAFFFIPYVLRSLTIGFLVVTDFLSFLVCVDSTVSYVDFVCRTFLLSFLVSSSWNIVENAMETGRVDPRLYFGTSLLLCLLAMHSLLTAISRHVKEW